jgi:transcription elongation factor GreA
MKGKVRPLLRISLVKTRHTRKDCKSMDKLYVTKEALEKMHTELVYRQSLRMTIAAEIEQARGYGDLKENAEYHAAKERQAMLHAEIRDMEDKIARAEVFDGSLLDATKALLGASVRVLNKKTKKEVTYKLVSPVEVEIAEGKISLQTPIGKALLGHSVGDIVIAKVPAGDIELEIMEITR